MKPIEKGQIVKFHTPYEDEGPEQLYVVLEVFDDEDRSRAQIFPLNTGLSFPPVVYIRDLEIDNILTKQLARYLKVTSSPQI